MSRVAELAESSMKSEAGGAEIFDLKVNYISPSGSDERLTATARVVHAGRRTVVTECRIDAPDGRLVATASATFAVAQEKEN
ncbi:MAG TPA: PaaI family thioesterase [Candidatus Acidoferrum sp.]|nr:PaaI family thioesterase [Candidatus Acidoferrum sp.]